MQTVLQHIFQTDKLEEVPLEALRQLTEKYPFFAPGQYLLSRKLYQTGDGEFDGQLKKTAIHFQNPLWLEHLLEIPADMAQVEITRHREPAPEMPLPAAEPEAVQAPDVVPDPILPEPALPPEVEIKEETSAPVTVEAAAPVAKSPDTGETPDPEPAQEVEPPLPLLKNILQTPLSPTDTLEITAFHTVDYFASQGIRLQPNEQQGDKLDRQMKSFTEWLKTMRRLPEARMETLEKVNEEAIQQQASGSLEEKDVVTETMAEVLVKQQHYDKAIRIYHKLGLQYPAKSAYFAAKIEALKS